MADLSIDLAGIRSPNPFWLASAPPTNSGYQVMRAFKAGWGGAVWKTLGDPIVNVTSRFAGIGYGSARMMGMNNIELITDRPLEDNLREIAECKAALSRPRDRRVADDGNEARALARAGQRRSGSRRRRVRTELRLPARNVRARDGLGGRSRSRTHRVVYALGRRSVARAGDRQAHAQHHRRSCRGARGGARRGARGEHDQHDQQPYRRRSRFVEPGAARRRPRAPTAAIAGPPSNRSRSTWSPTARATRRSTFRSAGSAGSRPGATPPNSCSWARPPSRSAPPSCTTASASSKT